MHFNFSFLVLQSDEISQKEKKEIEEAVNAKILEDGEIDIRQFIVLIRKTLEACVNRC